MSTRRGFDLSYARSNGFVLNQHVDGGSAIIIPLHSRSCPKHPCNCGADKVMPTSDECRCYMPPKVIDKLVKEREDAWVKETAESEEGSQVGVKEPYLFFGKFTASEVDAMSQKEKDYLILQQIDTEHDTVLGLMLNRYGAPNMTVCPRCHVDDFTHVEGCEFIPPEPDAV